MNILDIRTIMVNQLLSNAICAVVLIFTWLRNRTRFKGLFFWALDLAFQAIAVLLIALRGGIPNWMSFELANILVAAGAMAGFVGLEHFLDKKSAQIINFIFLVIFAAVFFYFTEITPSLEIRTIAGSISILFFSAQCVWLLFRRVGKEIQKNTRFTGYLFAGFCAVSLIRIGFIISNPYASNDFFQSGLYDALAMLAYQTLLILLTFSLILMVNRRLLLEVKTEEEKFSKAFISSPYAITLTRLPDGQMLEVNEGFLAISGYSSDEVIGKTTEALKLWVNEKDRDGVIDALRQGKSIRNREFQFRKKNGRKLTGIFSADIILIDGKPWILSSINDITKQKEAEKAVKDYSDHLEVMVKKRTRELRASQEKLARHERLAVLGQLAGSVGHELRAPLGVMANAVYFLKMAQPQVDPKISEYHDIIESEITNADKIITDLLDFSKIKSVDREAFNINMLCQQTLSRFSAPKGVKTSIDLPASLPMAYADFRQMTQVVGNLVLNAYQAMPDGGSLEISAKKDGSYIALAVRDSGTGIPKKQMEKLFDPLFTTKPRGIGLGLTVCKMLAEANGGKITVSSKEGKGSEFTILIPSKEKKP